MSVKKEKAFNQFVLRWQRWYDLWPQPVLSNRKNDGRAPCTKNNIGQGIKKHPMVEKTG